MTAWNARLLAIALTFVTTSLTAWPAFSAEPLKVVATFSILGDLVARVGGSHVTVRTLVGPNGDAHVYEPTPADARDAAAAGLIVVNGLGLEGWFNRLIAASGYAGPVATASDGVTPIGVNAEKAAGMPVDMDEGAGHHGATDPHAWQSVVNAEIYVKNIATALCGADHGNCADYRASAAVYTAELNEIDSSIKAGFAAIPDEKRKVITTHDAFGYFAREYGVTFLAPVGVSTEAEASAGDVAALIGQIRKEGVTAIFFENISDPRLIEQIASETGIRPGGELFSDALSEPGGPAASYADMMRHNAALLQSAMLGS